MLMQQKFHDIKKRLYIIMKIHSASIDVCIACIQNLTQFDKLNKLVLLSVIQSNQMKMNQFNINSNMFGDDLVLLRDAVRVNLVV